MIRGSLLVSALSFVENGTLPRMAVVYGHVRFAASTSGAPATTPHEQNRWQGRPFGRLL
jgi:hypothetical protein